MSLLDRRDSSSKASQPATTSHQPEGPPPSSSSRSHHVVGLALNPAAPHRADTSPSTCFPQRMRAGLPTPPSSRPPHHHPAVSPSHLSSLYHAERSARGCAHLLCPIQRLEHPSLRFVVSNAARDTYRTASATVKLDTNVGTHKLLDARARPAIAELCYMHGARTAKSTGRAHPIVTPALRPDASRGRTKGDLQQKSIGNAPPSPAALVGTWASALLHRRAVQPAWPSS